jgi:3-hydroxypropanoate dehydrogenase
MPLSDDALDVIFRTARTLRAWAPRPVSKDTLHAIYELMKWGPTSSNICPARIVFVTTAEGKARLEPALDRGNVKQTMAAPATAILAYDLEFYEKLPLLVPHRDAKKDFVGKPESIEYEATRSATLQGGYFIIAARALGLDCGPMGGFDHAKLDAEFFPEGKIKSIFLCNLGYGDGSTLRPRAPRLPFDEACRIV